MTLSVDRLLSDGSLGLTLVAGHSGTGRLITWAHAIELLDPTPWLSGGELVMTTGLSIPREAREQDAYVRRLVERGVTALAIDTGTIYEQVPERIRRAGDQFDFAVLSVAPDVPFIAIGRAVADALAADEVAAAKTVVDQQHRMARAALAGGIPGVVDSLAQSLDADVVVTDVRGTVLASAGREWSEHKAQQLIERRDRRQFPNDGMSADPHGHLMTQSLGVAGAKRGQLLVSTTHAPRSAARLLVSHALSLVSLELEKPARVLTVEHRLRAAVLRALLARVLLDDDSLTRYFGFAPDEPVRGFVVAGAEPVLAAETAVVDFLDSKRLPFLVASHADSVIGLMRADAPAELFLALGAAVGSTLNRHLTVGIGTAVPLSAATVTYRQALAATRAARGRTRGPVYFEGLGTYGLLLGGHSTDSLRALVTAALGPLEADDADPGRRSELLETLEVFLSCNGQWEATATALGVHRHTVRNRVDRIAALLGRDMESADDRAELWLALKAREMVAINHT